MKHSDSTEMDRLLRRYARRDGETLRAGPGGGDDAQASGGHAHLDADELNAYAEGALPETTRTRYYAHLADCESCRKLVTDLVLATGAASETAARAAAASPSKSWRDWLAAIFSPPVLRYGVPALALLAVIVVAALVALRAPQEQPSFVAQNDEAKRGSAQSMATNANSAAEIQPGTVAENHVDSNTTSNTAVINPQNSSNASTAPQATPQATPLDQTVMSPPPVADKPVVAKGETANNTSESIGDEKRAQKPVSVTATATAPPAPAPVASKRADDEDGQAKSARERDEATANTGAAGGVMQSKSVETEEGAGRASSRKVPGPAAASRVPSPKAGKDEAESSLSAETRNVAGHRFRRQGSAWVDAAYNSSYPTLNVPRGSEQYRSLVADEAGLRAITQQLGGEVIVVWGRKAYRFY